MNGNRASGLRSRYTGPSLHGGNDPDQKGIALKGDFRQASHTITKKGKPLTLTGSEISLAYVNSAMCSVPCTNLHM